MERVKIFAHKGRGRTAKLLCGTCLCELRPDAERCSYGPDCNWDGPAGKWPGPVVHPWDKLAEQPAGGAS